MNNETFTYKHLTISVRGGIGRDIYSARVIYNKVIPLLGDEFGDVHSRMLTDYATLVNQTINITGDIGFEWVNGDAPAKELLDAYCQWQLLPVDLLLTWEDAIKAADTPPGDKDLEPPDKSH